MFGEPRRIDVMEGELLIYWQASRDARAVANDIGRQSATYLLAVDDIQTVAAMTDWQRLSEVCERSLSALPGIRRPHLAVAG